MIPVTSTFNQSGAPATLTVVIDTEEEFDWNAPFDRGSTSVRNIDYQHLAQDVFSAAGIVPTYVVDYPVATSASSIAVLKPWLRAGLCEIGAHLHPWVNPPHDEEVTVRNSFASNLPSDLTRRKLAALRDCIVANFGTSPLVYKAGRYGIGPETPAILKELGFIADASVVPHLDSSGEGGPDFRHLPDRPFLTEGGVAELPLSVHFSGAMAEIGARLFPILSRLERWRLPGVFSRLGLLERLRLSPEDHGIADLCRQTRAALARGHRHFMLTYHSSSLMTGGSPYARTPADRDALVGTLTEYIGFFTSIPGWATLTASGLATTMRAQAQA
ncbi:MAG: glycosyltransferase [Acetobacteraceae bacterium]|nr:glycosyltransferase [Acetobacteraceae bacterium]